MQFGGSSKCLYPVQKFDSDAERQFANVLESDPDVLKWYRPVTGQLHIYFRQDRPYEPDFVVETRDGKVLAETKARGEVDADDVQQKKAAALVWCEHATAHEEGHGGKPWRYLLVPHDDVRANYTLDGLLSKYA